MDALARLQVDEVGGLRCEWMRPCNSELADNKDKKDEKRKRKRMKIKKGIMGIFIVFT